MDKMKEIMTKLRERPIASVGDLAVQCIEDYLSRQRRAADGTVSDIELPASNAVKLILERSAWICIRPSGTEPKIKIYYAVRSATREAAENRLKNVAADFEKMI
jgi:phosphoglucomutase